MEEEEVKQALAEFALRIEQTFAILAAACARQANANLLVNNLQGMKGSFAKRDPSDLRDRWIDAMCSYVNAVGVPVPPDRH